MTTIDRASVDHVLTTTRAVRRRLDLSRSVPDDVISECISIATQAPNGGNVQAWRFLVVTDSGKRKALAEIYRHVLEPYMDVSGKLMGKRAQDAYSDPGVRLLGDNLHRVPVHIIPCSLGKPDSQIQAFKDVGAPIKLTKEYAVGSFYASLYPAAWSLMLALRARGLGSSLITLQLNAADECAQILDIPPTVTQGGLLPVAYFTGDDFKPGIRRPHQEVIYWDTWGEKRI